MSMGEGVRELARAVRSLRRAPGFTLLVVLTLGLGVGANTAVFTVLDAVLLEPLPYPEAERLVRLEDVEIGEGQGGFGYLRAPVVAAQMEWGDVFEGVGTLYTYRELGADLTTDDGAVRLITQRVSHGYFETLGIAPRLGRAFLREESFLPEPGYAGAPVAVLSEGLWQRHFDGQSGALGETIELDGIRYEVVGVMPAGFEDPMGGATDVWLPQNLTEGGSNSWGNFYLTAIARLRPGLSREAAQSRLDALSARLAEANEGYDGWKTVIHPLQAQIVGPTRTKLLWILAVAVALILVSACVNVANVVFARSLSRQREVTVRGALGSGRGRLVLHLFSESVLLAAMGAVAGVALGSVGIRALLALAPDALPAVATPRLSSRVFFFGLASALGALLIFGLLPALRISATSPGATLRGGGRTGTQSRRLARIRGGLVVTQVGVAVLLVAGSGLLLKSFLALQGAPLGFDDGDVWTVEVHLPTSRYPTGAERHDVHQRFQRQVAALPGVAAAGAVQWLPGNGRFNTWGLAWVGEGWNGEWEGQDERWIGTDVRVIAGDYFESMGIRAVRGAEWREPSPDDPPVIWVNQAMTEHPDLGGVDPVGQLVAVGNEVRRIVGVVENTAHDPRGATSVKTYIPHAQFSEDRNWPLIQTIRLQPGVQVRTVREGIEGALAGIDAQLVLYRPRSMASLLDGVRAQERFAALLMTTFAGLALALAAVGAYGVLAGNVARRRREIGIRMALGAQPDSVRAMILGSAIRLSVFGVALGTGGAWYGARWLEVLLFEVRPNDPVVLIGAALTILGLGAVAGWLPARRATRVDPAIALVAE